MKLIFRLSLNCFQVGRPRNGWRLVTLRRWGYLAFNNSNHVTNKCLGPTSVNVGYTLIEILRKILFSGNLIETITREVISSRCQEIRKSEWTSMKRMRWIARACIRFGAYTKGISVNNARAHLPLALNLYGAHNLRYTIRRGNNRSEGVKVG